MNSAFRFKFRQLYDEPVEKRLYDVQKYDLIIQDHVLQLKSPERLQCLLCGVRIPLPISRALLKEHFATHASQENVNEHAFDFYHKTFFGLPNELQMEQIYFVPHDNESVYCSLCSKPVSAVQVRGHIYDTKHMLQVQMAQPFYWQHETPPNSVDEKQQEEKLATKCEESEDRKPSAAEEEESEADDVGENVDLLIHKSSKLTTCLQCKRTIEDIPLHMESEIHESLNTKRNMKDVKEYHYMWDTHFAKHIAYKKYFVVASSKTFKCLICNSRVLISHVPKHIKDFPCGFIHEQSPLFDNTHDWPKLKAHFVEKNAPKFEYDENVLEKFYHPKDIFDKVRNHDGLDAYTMQRRTDSNRVFCLLCRIPVCTLQDNVIDENEIFEHMKGKQHIDCSHNMTKIKHLYDYHRFLYGSKPQVLLMQHLINPYKNVMKCASCKRKFPHNELTRHITVGCAHARVGAGPVATKPEKPIETESDEDNEVRADVAPVVSDDTDDVDDDALCYDDETIVQIYPASNTPRGQRRPTILTIQKRSERFTFYCLACNVVLHGKAIEHIEGFRHEVAVKENFDIVTSYHHYWMKQRPEKQLDQIYFNPASTEHFACAICKRGLMFRDLPKHRCMEQMKKQAAQCVFPEEHRVFTANYHSTTMRRLFFGVHYDVTRDLLQTLIPLSFQHRSHIFCLMCSRRKLGKLYRDPELWKRHLCRQHLKSPDRDNIITYIVAFHEYWAQQTPERQLYLTHYTIQSRTSLLCTEGHIVPLNKAVEHIEQPDACKLNHFAYDEASANEAARIRTKSETKMRDATKTLSELDLNGREQPNGRRNEQRQPHQNREHGENENKEHIIESIFPAVRGNENAADTCVQLPIQLQKHQVFLSEELGPQNVTNVFCKLCKATMRNDVLTLRHHVSHMQHMKKAPADLDNRTKYFCEICLKYESKEQHWLNHLDSQKHVSTVQNMRQTRKDVAEHICHTCNMVIFGDKISLLRHKLSGGAGNKKIKPGTLTVGVKELLNTRRKIEEKAKSILKQCKDFDGKSQAKVALCLEALDKLLKANYPNCTIYQFGSRVAGFLTQDSDLDLFVDLDGTKYNGETHDSREQQKIVIAVKKLLKNEAKIFTDLHSILSARVPIIKVIHSPSEIDCDLSFANGLSVENTRLIKFYADYEPVFYESMLLLKEWGAQLSPKLKNDITSYALCMMLIFSMQVDGHLPSVQKLRECSTFDVVGINGWDTVKYADLKHDVLVASTKKAQSVADAVVSFFRYYGNFRFDSDVACPLLGRTFNVDTFANKGEQLPMEMVTYKKKVASDPDAQFRCTCHMFVQDPFDLGHNVTKSAKKDFVKNFKKICQLSFEHATRQ